MSEKEPSSSKPIVNTLGGISIKGTPLDGQVLQFNQSENVFEWVDSSSGGMGDLEFLRDKENAGDMIKLTSSFTNVGVTISYIPPIGKTFFLISARVIRIAGVLSTSDRQWNCEANIKSDIDIIDRLGWSGSTEESAGEGPGAGWGGDSKTVILSASLIGNGVKEFTIDIITLTSTADGHKGIATLTGWIEDSV